MELTDNTLIVVAVLMATTYVVLASMAYDVIRHRWWPSKLNLTLRERVQLHIVCAPLYAAVLSVLAFSSYANGDRSLVLWIRSIIEGGLSWPT